MSIIGRMATWKGGASILGGGDGGSRLDRTMSEVSGNAFNTESQFKALSPAAAWWKGVVQKIQMAVNHRSAILGRGFMPAGAQPT